MGVLIIAVALIFLALFVPKTNGQKGILGAVLALLFFPIWVILALAKRYK